MYTKLHELRLLSSEDKRFIAAAVFFYNYPGVVNRTFGNRTQSNPITRLGSIGFGNRT